MGPKGGRPTRQDALAIAQRRARVALAYLKGEYQHDIAAREGLATNTICADLKAIQAQWRQSSIRDFDEHRARELAKLDLLERTYWEAWEACPRARYLDGVRQCIADRCRLLGLVSDPARQEINVLLARLSGLEALIHEPPLLAATGNGTPGPGRTEALIYQGQEAPTDGPPADAGGQHAAGPVAG